MGLENLLSYIDHPELDEIDKLVIEYVMVVTNNAGKIRDACHYP